METKIVTDRELTITDIPNGVYLELWDYLDTVGIGLTLANLKIVAEHLNNRIKELEN